MIDTDDFLAEILPRLHAAEVALHRGDAGPRCELWSEEDPVTLFGAEVTRSGRSELESTFEWALRLVQARLAGQAAQAQG